MREIKFRVWDKDECKYVDGVGDLYITINEVGTKMFRLEQLCPGRYVIELSTGLKDKNGKEKYDGDIVKEELYNDVIDVEYAYQVLWNEERLCWSLSPNFGNFHIDLWDRKLSIIVFGNIHEKP